MELPDTVTIAITYADDTLGVMTFVTAEYDDDAGVLLWQRQATSDAVDMEVRRTVTTQPGKLPVKSWRPIDPRDLPTDRATRDRWRDTGTAIIVADEVNS